MVDKVKQAADKSSTGSVYEYESKRSVLKNVQAQRSIAKLRAYAEGTWLQKTTSQRGLESTRGTRIMRALGAENIATFVELFMVDAQKAEAKRKRKDKDEDQPTVSGDSGIGRRTSARMLGVLRDVRRDTMITRTVVTGMSSELSDMGKAVNDIKSLIMPKQFNVRVNKRNQGVSFNPLAPSGEQLRLVEKGEITNIAPGSRIKERAIQKAAWIGASTAFKIEKKDRKDERRKKNVYKDPKESAVRGDPVLAFLVKIDKRLDRIEDLLKDGVGGKKGLGALGAAAAGAGGAAAASAAGAAGAALLRNIKPIGLASIPLAGLWLAQDQADKAMKYVEGGGDIDTYTGWNPFVQTAKRGRQFSNWFTDKFMKGRTEKNKKKAAENAAAGRMPGGVSSTKGMSWVEAIDHFDKMAKDPKNTEQQREAYARVRDNLKQQMKERFATPNGTVTTPPVMPTSELVSDIERDSDSWDTNYATPAPPPTSRGPTRRGGARSIPSVGNTGTLSSSTYESRIAALGDAIASGESGGDYNVFNKGSGHGYRKAREDLSKMTLEEYMRRGTLPSKHPDKMFATGKYQIIPKTMASAIETLGLNKKTTLTPETQEYIFREFLTKSKRPAIHNFLTGKSNDQNAALVDIAKEWASVGVPQDMMGEHRWVKKGESYYSDDGINKAHTAPEKISSALTPVSRPDGSLLAGPVSSGPRSSDSVGSVSINPVTIQNNTQNNTVANRPATRASATSNDPSLVRNATRDIAHPVYSG